MTEIHSSNFRIIHLLIFFFFFGKLFVQNMIWLCAMLLTLMNKNSFWDRLHFKRFCYLFLKFSLIASVYQIVLVQQHNFLFILFFVNLICIEILNILKDLTQITVLVVPQKKNKNIQIIKKGCRIQCLTHHIFTTKLLQIFIQ